ARADHHSRFEPDQFRPRRHFGRRKHPAPDVLGCPSLPARRKLSRGKGPTAMDNMFFDCDPIQEAPFLELPNFQEGSLPCKPPRNDYSLLEPLRPFLFQNYDPYMWVIPRTAILNAQVPTGVLPGQQIEDRIQLPKGCWIVGFAGHAAGIGF